MSHWNWKKRRLLFRRLVCCGRAPCHVFVSLSARLFLDQGSAREGRGGGSLLFIQSLKWNPNDVLTTCTAISKGLASGLIMRITWKNIDWRFWKEQKHSGPRRDCFSLLYFCSSQILSLFRHSVSFSVSVKEFSPAEFGICNIWLRITDKNHGRVELSSSVICCKP